MFLVKCLSSERLVCFNPTITPLKRRLCDWWTTRPTMGSVPWPYYQNIQEYFPYSKAAVSVTVDLFIDPPVQIKFGEHWKEYLYVYSICVCVWVCIWVSVRDKERQMKGEGGRTVWICVYVCMLYVYCNMTPINLTDGLIIITKCRCGELNLGSLWLPVIWWVILWLKRWWPLFDSFLFHHHNW